MPDQKPTLEYETRDPLQSSRTITRIINGAVSLVLAGLGLLNFLWAALILWQQRFEWVSVFIIVGSLLFWLAWANLKWR